MTTGAPDPAAPASPGARSTFALPAIVGAVLQGAAGMGAVATTFGFLAVASRLVAAELPVVEGIELVGLRTVIATGARSLAPLIPILVVAAPVLAVALVGGARRAPAPGATQVRQVVFFMTFVSVLLVLFGILALCASLDWVARLAVAGTALLAATVLLRRVYGASGDMRSYRAVHLYSCRSRCWYCSSCRL